MDGSSRSPHAHLNWCSRWHGKIDGCLGWGIKMSGKVQICTAAYVSTRNWWRVCAGFRCIQMAFMSCHVNGYRLDGYLQSEDTSDDGYIWAVKWLIFCGIWVQSSSISFFILTQMGHKNISQTQQIKKRKDREKTMCVSQNRSLAAVQRELAAVH